MKVAIIVPVFPQLSETFIVSKVLGLVERGLDVHVVCSSSPDEQWSAFSTNHPVHGLRSRVHKALPTALPDTILASGRAFVELATHHRPVARRYVRAARNDGGSVLRGLFIDQSLIELAPDVVHFEFGSGAVGRHHLRERLDTAVTVSFRGSDLNVAGLDNPDFYGDVWPSIDRVHVLGRSLAAAASRRGAPPTLPVDVIPPAVDLSAVSPPNDRQNRDPSEPLRILSVGRLHWTKGYQYGLEAVAYLHRQGIRVHLRVVGAGALLEAVAFWRHQLGLNDIVELTGAAAPYEVQEHQRWADVFLHAAVTEGFCNVVLEAQAHALPVVCSDAGGLPENVEHDLTGIVVPRRDPIALADAMKTLTGDPNLRARMGAAGRRRVEARFQITDQLDAWEQFYRDAVTSRRSASLK